MHTNRPRLTIAAEIATISTAVVGFLLWLYRTVLHGASWSRAMTGLVVVLAMSFTANILFWIASLRQDAAIAEGEAALFRHYAACSRKLAMSLEAMRHRWQDAGLHLVHPLGNKDGDSAASDLESFKAIYRDHLEWLEFEIPEFDSSDLPSCPSNAEYLDVVRALRLHGKQLNDAADLIGLKHGK